VSERKKRETGKTRLTRVNCHATARDGASEGDKEVLVEGEVAVLRVPRNPHLSSSTSANEENSAVNDRDEDAAAREGGQPVRDSVEDVGETH
jgi:hypothetical protein